MSITLRNFLKLIFAIAVCELAGVIGSFFTVSAIPNWYSALAKPALNPPSWVFAPVWIMLYALMGAAAWLVWIKGLERKEVKRALIIFDVQLILNAAWSIIFFGLHSIGGALADIIVLWFGIAWSVFLFYKISKPAAYLLLPYLAWVSFAMYLNYSIFILN